MSMPRRVVERSTARSTNQRLGTRQKIQPDTVRLSRLQRRILRWLKAEATRIREFGSIRAEVVLDILGVPRRPGARGARHTH
jgi:hypothetical protein